MALGCAQAFAKTYTLEECIELAKQTDPDYERYRNSVNTAGKYVWSQVGNFLPSLNFRTNFINSVTDGGPFLYIDNTVTPPDSEYVTSQTNRYYSSSASINWTLFDGFQNVWGYLASKKSKAVADNDLTSSESNLKYSVKGSYYLVLKSKRDLEVADETVKRSEELLKLFQEKYELGSASKSEVLKQKVQYGNDKLTKVKADNTYRLAKYQLAITIGIDPRTDFDIEDIGVSKSQVEPLNKLIKEATALHPSLLAANADLAANKYGVRSAYGSYLPQLSLTYSMEWQRDKFKDVIKLLPYERTNTTYLTFSWNIFDGFTREYNVSRAKATYNNAKAMSFYTKNKVIKDIEDAYMGVKLAEETLSVTEETERSAAEDFDLVQTKYNLGAAALWELLDAQVSLKSAQFNKVSAEFDYNLAHAKLLNAMGR